MRSHFVYYQKKRLGCCYHEYFVVYHDNISMLEYCVQVWSPYKQGDIDLIEKVQERATRLVPGLRGKSYEDRLEKLGLIRLVERRFRGDMIETHKIMSDREGVRKEDFFRPQVERGDPELSRGRKIFKERPGGLKDKMLFHKGLLTHGTS